MNYVENLIFPLFGFGVGLSIGCLMGFLAVFFFMSGRKLHTIKILYSFDWLEYLLIFGTPVAIILYRQYDSNSIINFLKIIHSGSLWPLCLLVIGCILLIRCYFIKVYEENPYDPSIHATLRAEKDEFTIWAGIASLLVFVLKEPEYLRPEEPKSLLILSAFYLLLIISVYYRHLSQAIYMQEAKEK